VGEKKKEKMLRYEGRYVGRRRDGLTSGCKLLDAWMHIQENRKEKKISNYIRVGQNVPLTYGGDTGLQ